MWRNSCCLQIWFIINLQLKVNGILSLRLPDVSSVCCCRWRSRRKNPAGFLAEAVGERQNLGCLSSSWLAVWTDTEFCLLGFFIVWIPEPEGSVESSHLHSSWHQRRKRCTLRDTSPWRFCEHSHTFIRFWCNYPIIFPVSCQFSPCVVLTVGFVCSSVVFGAAARLARSSPVGFLIFLDFFSLF